MKKFGKLISSRRDFLKISGAGVAGLVAASNVGNIFASPAASLAVGPGNKWPGRVVINFNKSAVNNSAVDNQAVIAKMVDDAILNLTGAATVGAAWKSVFPASLTETSKIALKVPVGYNNSKSVPNRYLVKGIVDGLQKMTFGTATFPAGNIYIYDMNGYQNYDTVGITNTLMPGVHIVYDSNGGGYTDGANGMQYATTLHNCNFLINVPSLRGHSAEMGSVTLGFKAHYGTYAPVHGDPAPAYLRDINCTGAVYNKTVLTVVSAIYGQNLSNGPGGSPDLYGTYAKTIDSTSANNCPTTLIMSTDPVSAEMQAIKIMRINLGQAYDTNSMPAFLKISAGIASSYGGASLAALNIGTIDESSMDIRRIINDNAPGIQDQTSAPGIHGTRITAYQIRGGRSAFLEFTVPESQTGKKVAIEICDAKGTIVRSSSHKVLGAVNHFSWDEADARGNAVASGTYVAHLVTNLGRASSPFTIVR